MKPKFINVNTIEVSMADLKLFRAFIGNQYQVKYISWNEIMPAIQLIEYGVKPELRAEVTIRCGFCEIKNTYISIPKYSVITWKIISTWIAIIDYIKWYNKHNNG